MLRDPVSPRDRGRLTSRRGGGVVAAGALITLTVTACGAPLPALGPDQSPSAYSGLAVDGDRIDYAVGKVSDIVGEEMDASGVPGVAVAVVHDGEVVHSEGYGVRSTETDDEVHTDTVFPLGSVSESVSATVVAAQDGAEAARESDGGRDAGPGDDGATNTNDDATDTGTPAPGTSTTTGVEGETTRRDVAAPDSGDADSPDPSVWSTPVRDALPWFALSDPRLSSLVTVGDLFAHRSGLPERAGDALASLGYDRPTILHGLRNLPVNGFRDTFAYTDFGVTAGAEAVAVDSGDGWAELARESLLDPLGMADSSYSHAELLERTDRAVGHVRPAGAEGDTGWSPAPTDVGAGVRAPATGMSSSAEDMARWMMMVLADGAAPDGTRVVPEPSLRRALTPQVTATAPASAADRTESYGFGFTITDSSSGRVQWSDAGAHSRGPGTSLLLMPSLDLGIITLTNADPVGTAETINARFADLAQYGDPTITWRDRLRDEFAPLLAPAGDLVGQMPPSMPVRPRPLDQLTGPYTSEHFGEVTVRREDDRLLLDFGRGQQPWRLEHWDGDVFAASPAGENWPEGTRGSVRFDDDEVRIQLLDGNGLGTFTRVEEPEPDQPGP